jgi:phosphoenolpyruvate---glycerone phosphotransferase subunit DhaM
MPAMTHDTNGAGLVTLVLVSHSATIAQGVAELAAQVAGPEVAIVPIGGADDGSLGTDGERVREALAAAASGQGGVVLMDIGSSVLAVKAALNELPPAQLDRLFVADAPLVEGAIAAAVTASMGSSAREVANAAEGARSAAKL